MAASVSRKARGEISMLKAVAKYRKAENRKYYYVEKLVAAAMAINESYGENEMTSMKIVSGGVKESGSNLRKLRCEIMAANGGEKQ